MALEPLTCQVALVAKHLPASAGDIRGMGSVPGPGRSPGGGLHNPLQYACRENPMDRGVHGVAKSWTWLKQLNTKETPDSPVTLPLCENIVKKHGQLWTRKWALTRYQICWHLILKVTQPPVLWEKISVVYTVIQSVGFFYRFLRGLRHGICMSGGSKVSWSINSLKSPFLIRSVVFPMHFL